MRPIPPKKRLLLQRKRLLLQGGKKLRACIQRLKEMYAGTDAVPAGPVTFPDVETGVVGQSSVETAKAKRHADAKERGRKWRRKL